MDLINPERPNVLDENPLVVVSTMTAPKDYLTVGLPSVRAAFKQENVLRGLVQAGWTLLGTDRNTAYLNRDHQWKTN